MATWSDDELRAHLATVPITDFGGASQEARLTWVRFVTAADEAPRDNHELLFYSATARVLAETIGSVAVTDYADTAMRAAVLALGWPVG